MKGATSWSYRPYRPPMWDSGDIYICRLYPDAGTIRFDFIPLMDVTEYEVRYRVRGTEAFTSVTVSSSHGDSFVKVTLTGLSDHTDYEFYVTAGGKKSRVRLARTGSCPGDVVVNYLHPEDEAFAYSGRYLCSPSIVRMPDGALIASMDVFEGGRPQDLSFIFRSEDDGRTWEYMCDLFPCFWGKLFVHRGILYMLAVSTEYGDLMIGKSTDGGRSFGIPSVLLRGSSGFRQKGVHKNPEPVLLFGGRLWETIEWGSWASGSHAAMVASVPEDADLLDPSVWLFSEPVPYDPLWEGTAKGPSSGNIEGSLVVDPAGRLVSVMRYGIEKCIPNFGKAIIYDVDTDRPEEPLVFERVIDFPGNHSKFVIRYDEKTGEYWSLVSYLTKDHPSGRNWLALISSDDLYHWKWRKDIFRYDDMPASEIGFQYVDFFIEGNELLTLCRTAWNGAHNFHDANYSVFTRIELPET